MLDELFLLLASLALFLAALLVMGAVVSVVDRFMQ